ncbi:MAG: carbamoyltransferase HypF [candidate division WOR-3 bacterium]
MKGHLERSLRVEITGQVQGLGFRPLVVRVAKALGLRGRVFNTGQGVTILCQGRNARRLVKEVLRSVPSLCAITSIKESAVETRRFSDFAVGRSPTSGKIGVFVLPDLAICRACQKELFNPKDRRFRYPFINCTLCGPRWTIIEGLPYDRPRTTMRRFRMCPECSKEFHDPGDRRFHAQPIACPDCGPKLSLLNQQGKPLPEEPISAAAAAILEGKVVAVKGLGGFHLACAAWDDHAVLRLRQRKHRPAKPFALMCANVAEIRRFAVVSRTAERLLTSPAAPIVLLPKLARPSLKLSKHLAPANGYLGVMLAYTPLHLLLLHEVARQIGGPAVLVMTSANRRDEPIVSTEAELQKELPGVFDLILTHDRPIANRCDDSVIMVQAAPERRSVSFARRWLMVRRARGYAPRPILLKPMFHVKHPILALGGEMRNCFALASGNRVFLSPHIGSLAAARSLSLFEELLRRLGSWTGINPALVACDLHPDYTSTRVAEEIASRRGLPLVRVQHHVAHTLSVIAEHGIAGPVLGLSCDGTGYGTDGTIWGCEYLLVDEHLAWRRLGHLAYLEHNEGGGELASPARVAAAYLDQAGMASEARLIGLAGPKQGRLSRRPSTTKTSSLGRLFDAIAAIAGICTEASYEGEAAIALEAAATGSAKSAWHLKELFIENDGQVLLSPVPFLCAAVRDRLAGVTGATIAARFHATLAAALSRLAVRLCRTHHIRIVSLSGGSFQNSLLRQMVTNRLSRVGLAVYCSNQVPMNDGGLALGQVLAASRWKL